MKTPTIIQAVLSLNDSFSIGDRGKLIHHIPEDMAWFKRQTKNSVMVMGRKTFESLPGILPGRKHVVITSNPKSEDTDQVEYWSDPVAALLYYAVRTPKISIIGGAKIFEETQRFCNRVYLTEIFRYMVGDTRIHDTYYFDLMNHNTWYQRSGPVQTSKDGTEFRFSCFDRRASGLI